MKIQCSYHCTLSKKEHISSEDLSTKYEEHRAPIRKTSESPLIKKNKTDSINYYTGMISNNNFTTCRASFSTSELKEFVPIENGEKAVLKEFNQEPIIDNKNGSNPLKKNQNSENEENLCKMCHIPEGYALKKSPKQMRKQSSFLQNEINKDELNKSASPESLSFLFNQFNLDEGIEKDDNAFEDFLNMSQKNNTINYCNHVYETVESIKILKKLNPSLKEGYKNISIKINLPPCKKEMTIIFDLDETLIHLPKRKDEEDGEIMLQFLLTNGDALTTGINVRPFAKESLKELSQFSEIIIFTAGLKQYADVIVNYLDPTREYISYVLTREHCVYDEENNLYIKDLRILNRDLSRVAIIDNCILSFAFQLDNGIPALPFYKNKNDWFLKRIVEYLNMLREASDVRELNRKQFGLQAIYELEISKYLSHYSKFSEEKTDQHTFQTKKEDTKNMPLTPSHSLKRHSFYLSENSLTKKANFLLLPDYSPELSHEGKEFIDSILCRYNVNIDNSNNS